MGVRVLFVLCMGMKSILTSLIMFHGCSTKTLELFYIPVGLACVKSTATDDMLDITINVKENDETFVYDGGPDDSELVT